jgi:hypothetical protein
MNFRTSGLESRLFRLALFSSLLTSGCAHQSARPELEPRKFSREVGLAGCEVSVPLSRDETLDFARRLGSPDLAASPEWTEAIALTGPGDHVRHVYCPKNTDNFFGVFRGESILFKFGSFIYD